MYREALADATHDQLESMKAKLDVCERMGLRPDHVLAALSVVAERMQELESSSEVEDPRVKKVLVFTGHRVDDEDRSEPRFPRTKAAEQRAAEMIREAIQAELEGCEGEVAAYAGGASGSDILFHEACRALDVRTRLFLPGPKDEYLDAAVQNAGGEWVGRFNELHNSMCKEQRVRELGPSMGLPRWLQAEEDYSITQRSNLWILHNALKRQADEVVLIALWNKQQVEGSGGSEDMQQKARKRGAKVIVLDANELVVGHSDE
jgi:hypothetical protein